MLTFFLVVGLVCLGVYLFLKPRTFSNLADTMQRTHDAIDTRKADLGFDSHPERVDSTASLDDQFLDLKAGEMFTYDENGLDKGTRLIVKGVGQLQEMNHRGAEFSPRGESRPVYFGEDFMVFQRPNGWYILIKNQALEGETARTFDAHGIAFGDASHNQQPGSYEFDWEGEHIALISEGYATFELTAGRSHLTDGVLIKYLIGILGDTEQAKRIPSGIAVMYLENVKTGTDRIWHGKFLGESLDDQHFVYDVLRAAP